MYEAELRSAGILLKQIWRQASPADWTAPVEAPHFQPLPQTQILLHQSAPYIPHTVAVPPVPYCIPVAVFSIQSPVSVLKNSLPALRSQNQDPLYKKSLPVHSPQVGYSTDPLLILDTSPYPHFPAASVYSYPSPYKLLQNYFPGSLCIRVIFATAILSNARTYYEFNL